MEFVDWFQNEYLKNMTPEDYNKTIESEISKRKRPMKSLESTAEVYWDEIKHGTFVFDRKAREL